MFKPKRKFIGKLTNDTLELDDYLSRKYTIKDNETPRFFVAQAESPTLEIEWKNYGSWGLETYN
jgi:hypothetical protein